MCPARATSGFFIKKIKYFWRSAAAAGVPLNPTVSRDVNLSWGYREGIFRTREQAGDTHRWL